MPGVAAILRFSAALVLWWGFSPSVYAQLPQLDPRTGATKFDEFGKIGHCDLTAKLDNLTPEPQQLERIWIVPKGQPLPDPHEEEFDDDP